MKDVLDNISVEKETILFSKASILIVSILFSPFYGGFLYCSNLRFTNQKNKINRTFITIIISYLMLQLPLMGFEISTSFVSSNMINVPLLISKTVTALLMTTVLWKKQFEHINYKTIFPWFRVISIVIIEIALTFYQQWIYSESFSELNLPLNRYYIDFSLLTIFTFIFYFTIGDFIIRLLFSKNK